MVFFVSSAVQPGCKLEVIELASLPGADKEDSILEERADALEQGEKDYSVPDMEHADMEHADADKDSLEPEAFEMEGDHENREVGDSEEQPKICEKACYLLDDCGFLQIPGSPFGNTLEACLAGAGSPGCDKLWDLDPKRAQCVLAAPDCNGLWSCLVSP
ncbi:MAG: hypothetical protein GXP49_15350 [Deltaproteobacteria bacterium]|nr:hypothetical protein [Deltaproteobacteria bacterium]